MKRVGIITHYYDSLNYGGNLQAYALTQFLIEHGYAAEQISFVFKKNPDTLPTLSLSSFRKKLLQKGIRGCYRALRSRTWGKISRRRFIMKRDAADRADNVTERRKKAFALFSNDMIAHSERVYTPQTVVECVKDYDAFITGSDQVWNFRMYFKAFYLDFVPSDKIKLSYAASVASPMLTHDQKMAVQKSLADYKAVSLREKNALAMMTPLCQTEPVHVLDPTLLFQRQDWEKVCSERVVAEDYVFCYFLGNNQAARRAAERYAAKRGLKTVYIAFASGDYNPTDDEGRGDLRLVDVSPQDFISLVKYADRIFTDSFHAVVFSYLFEKQFYVFNRSKAGEMSTRITDITALFGASERFCQGKKKEDIAYIESLDDLDYSAENAELTKKRQESIDFLLTNLGDENETQS